MFTSVDPALTAIQNTPSIRFPILRLSSSSTHLNILPPGTPVSHGNCDPFRGLYPIGATTILLALKRPRTLGDTASQAIMVQRRLQREARIWTDLDHGNILPFYGLVELASDAYLIFPWVEQGDLAKFLMARLDYFALSPDQQNTTSGHTRDSFLTFDKWSTIFGIASGLAYLHTKNVIHGDLKGLNILLGDSSSATSA